MVWYVFVVGGHGARPYIGLFLLLKSLSTHNCSTAQERANITVNKADVAKRIQ